jgi:hypothetical protein
MIENLDPKNSEIPHKTKKLGDKSRSSRLPGNYFEKMNGTPVVH